MRVRSIRVAPALAALAVATALVPRPAATQNAPPPPDLPLVTIPPTAGANGPLVLILSGDGDWAAFVQRVAADAAAAGSPVVGLESCCARACAGSRSWGRGSGRASGSTGSTWCGRSIGRKICRSVRSSNRLAGLAVVCVCGEDEARGLCADPLPGMRVRTHPGGHRVPGNDAEVSRMILAELGLTR